VTEVTLQKSECIYQRINDRNYFDSTTNLRNNQPPTLRHNRDNQANQPIHHQAIQMKTTPVPAPNQYYSSATFVTDHRTTIIKPTCRLEPVLLRR
jgi:hypothetical protein